MKKDVTFILILLFVCMTTWADDSPTISPTLKVISAPESDGDSVTIGEQTSSYDGSAPADLLFEANAQNTEGWTATYEWHFFNKDKTDAILIRYDKDTEYTFTESGSFTIELWATFTKGTETITYDHTYYSEGGAAPTVSISESSLSFPNAFSPNGDGINDTYGAKSGYKSIIEFNATIFNRWGQKIYSWNSPSGSWDGTFNGKPAKEGTYFVLVKAKGSDGKKYNIKRDVNLLR
jgi:gliding motility-associated-like protein